MKSYQIAVIFATILLLTVSLAEAKRKKHKSADSSSSSPGKTKTKTKWSTSTDLGENSQNSMIATEEHGYYVKRTFLPLSANQNDSIPRSPPFLAVPIAWFPCADPEECMKLNSLALNSNKNSLSQGFLCDDDCQEPYQPICGKTSTEVAVFYNKCKLNVAKCRSHGYWLELPFEACNYTYPDEVKYADTKFRANPYFKEQKPVVAADEILVALTDNQIKAENEATAPVLANDKKGDTLLMIKEIHEIVPQTKLKDSKDHYEKIPNESKESKESKESSEEKGV